MQNVKFILKGGIFFVYIDNKLFFFQKFLISNNKNVSNKVYTYFYVLKIMNRFGLLPALSQLKKK
jgi:recombinational DNA repair protein (RecF pathway)